MANIDDLKQSDNSISIDISGKTPVMNNNEAPSNNVQKVVLGAPNKKTVVKPKSTSPASSGDRIEFDLTKIPVEKDPLIHDDPVADMLEGPDSMFGKYLENKSNEFREWAEEHKAEEELKAVEEVEDVKQPDGSAAPVVDELTAALSAQEDALSDDEDDVEDFTNMNIMDDELFADEEDKDVDLELDNDQVLDTDNFLEDNDEPLDTVDEFAIDEDSAVEVEPEPVVEEKVVETPRKEEKPKKIEVDTSDIVLDDNSSTVLSSNDVVVEEEEDSVTDTQDEIREHLRKLATEKIKPVSTKLDLSSFTIVKKPTSNTSFLQNQSVNVAKWVLPGQNSIVHMKEFLGSELEQLREYSEDMNSLSSMTRRFRMIYDHIASPKPSTYEAWIKSTPYSDVDHYFFAIFIACYKGANFIPKDCDKCKETFLTDDIPIMDMVKFKSEEAKAKFQKIYQNESIVSNKDGLYVTEVVPLSDRIAVSFKEPSIYSLIEIASLDDRFKEKYAATIQYMPYLDSLYIIDAANQTLVPIGYKGYAENAVKTIKSKIQKFNAVLNTLPSDQFNVIKSYINAIDEKEDEGISYIFPSVTCPKCGTVSEETEASAEALVFTRYQLGNLVTTSLK